MNPLQCLIILTGTLTIAFGQKIAPGVPPQHYVDPNQHYQQQQVPQMQYVQPGMQQMHPAQHAQQPIHQQQPIQQQPMQQQPIQHQPIQQQPIQQQPIQQQPIQPQAIHQDPNTLHQQQQMGAAPQGHRHPQQVLDTANIQGEKAHIQEHIDVPMDTSKMSEQELQFHYFKMHDSDHNNKLDGCELIKSLIHWHEKSNKDTEHHKEDGGHHEKIFSDEELVALIDPILAMDDTGRDGYIDYPEFIKAQQKAAVQNKVEKP